MKTYPFIYALLTLIIGLFLQGCNPKPEDISDQRYNGPDKLYQQLETNIKNHADFDFIVDIDHSRLAKKAGSIMPPAHVIIWSYPQLEADVIREQPLAALEFPFRALAYEQAKSQQASVITNSYQYLVNRYQLNANVDREKQYNSVVESAFSGIPAQNIETLPDEVEAFAGITTLDSPYDFEKTKQRVMSAIKAQSDTVVFGEVNFNERARSYGVDLPPLVLVLFGGPGPGGKAMAAAPTLGLNGFCQKLLIWQGDDGKINVSFNDLLDMAKQQNAETTLPLRVVNRRLNKTFSDALE
ncbi:DUF302 domain-containing protein [Thalassotalea litorea]|uniref:DUF302 domain-containing protein n=1 Tax=Thalassotalea litorea TaxID=2020715 RepID=A0A5R9IQG6_9GAMM|nr:DUF302 domain-containing protein [Thalassotalea litorea]TLU64128.1 DUF302 domain-containing protein [Thalassotalea litorea]